MKVGKHVEDRPLREELVEMIADVAVRQTENHLEVIGMFKDRDVQICGLRADMDQVKVDVAQVKADVAQVKASVSSINARLAASEFAAEKRHDELIVAIRGVVRNVRTQPAIA